MKSNFPEILAPVATMEMCKAAVHNGADAIYIGMPQFNARGRTKDFTIEELQSIIEYCHLYGVKVFIALNILIFQNELKTIVESLKQVVKLSPDAFIIQDIGLIRLINELFPGQTVHASTQMTVTNSEAIELTTDLGIKRYVLGREVSIGEMQKIRDNTTAELEVFVHGALCVSYSGQCLTSERVGGRSANRGQCAQSCRLPYDLIVDGTKKELSGKRYLVSPQDLCALEDVEKLKEIGIDSFKIEGRLKSPEYVASTVKAYKEKVLSDTSSITTDKLETIYSRGFFNGWMDGVNHQELVGAKYSNHHGKEIGKVLSCNRDSLLISSTYNLKAGDGLVFCDFESGKEYGAGVYCIETESKSCLKISLSNKFNLALIKEGMTVFCNSSPKLEKEVAATFRNKQLEKKIKISATLKGEPGSKLLLFIEDEDGNQVEAVSSQLLETSINAPLEEDFLRNEIAALSNTCFTLASFNLQLSGPSYIHQREIKEMRRNACADLIKLRTSKLIAKTVQDLSIDRLIKSDFEIADVTPIRTAEPVLNILIRDISQIESLRNIPATTIYLDFEFGKEYAPAINELKALGHRVGIATTRILKPGENSHLKQIIRLKPEVILVRNLGALQYLKEAECELVGDFSLNVTNSLTAKWMLSKGLSRYCPSYDLNQYQLFDLLFVTGGSTAEVTIHQYMPAFHMEHCVFAAFLSNGSSYRDCGRPCEKYRVELRDDSGATHPLKADAECRNTMFHGIPQSSARLIPQLIAAGVKNYRFEALYETAAELKSKIGHYLSAIKQEITTDKLFEVLKISEKYGVSEGQLLSINRYKDRKKIENRPNNIST